MIRDDEDFHPIDHEDIIQNTRKTKGLNLNNVIAFLREQGADESMIRLVEDQCSANEKGRTKEKQSISGSTDASQEPTMATATA